MSLSEETIRLIKATVPALQTYGEQITQTFYTNMFSEHPELFNIFNRTNFNTGRQPRALAQAVLATAQYIDNLGVLKEAVSLIAHKHKSLGVSKEQYPIVGENLLKAIKEVLKEAATDEIINAWKTYYNFLAKIFIDAEESLYQKSESMEGGWRYTKEFVVDKKVKEGSSVTSFYFKPTDGGPVPLHEPGQYIVVSLTLPNDKYVSNRQYSLSDIPNNEYFRISVNRETGNDLPGKISNHLHDHLNVGDKIMLHAPSGNFLLKPTEMPIVFLAAGVGITPLLSMLKYLSMNSPEKEVTLVHSVRHGNLFFYDELMQIKEKMPNFTYLVVCSKQMEIVHHVGRVDEEWVLNNLNLASVFYVCGPIEYMKTVLHILKDKGVDSNDLNYEYFGPFVNV